MDKRKRQEILATPCGAALNLLVETAVFERRSCACGSSRDLVADTGCCAKCNLPFAALWSESHSACVFLLKKVKEWAFQKRNRFLDFLGDAIAFRTASGKIEPKQWILLGTPQDICRAAVLACSEQN